MAPKEGAEIFVENVIVRYIIAIQDLPKKQHDRGRISLMTHAEYDKDEWKKEL